jgi:hypothetical protein
MISRDRDRSHEIVPWGHVPPWQTSCGIAAGGAAKAGNLAARESRSEIILLIVVLVSRRQDVGLAGCSSGSVVRACGIVWAPHGIGADTLCERSTRCRTGRALDGEPELFIG